MTDLLAPVQRAPLYNLAIGGAFPALALRSPALVSEGSSKLALCVTRSVRIPS